MCLTELQKRIVYLFTYISIVPGVWGHLLFFLHGRIIFHENGPIAQVSIELLAKKLFQTVYGGLPPRLLSPPR